MRLNKFSEEFIADFYSDWQEGGRAAIRKVREEKPSDYLRVATSLPPRHHKGENQFANMTDEQIDQRIRELNAAIAAKAWITAWN